MKKKSLICATFSIVILMGCVTEFAHERVNADVSPTDCKAELERNRATADSLLADGNWYEVLYLCDKKNDEFNEFFDADKYDDDDDECVQFLREYRKKALDCRMSKKRKKANALVSELNWEDLFALCRTWDEDHFVSAYEWGFRGKFWDEYFSDKDTQDAIFATEYKPKAEAIRVSEKRQKALELLKDNRWIDVIALCKGEADAQLVENMNLAEANRVEEKRISVKKLVDDKNWQGVVAACDGEKDDVLADFRAVAERQILMLSQLALIDDEYSKMAGEYYSWMMKGLSALQGLGKEKHIRDADIIGTAFLQNSIFSMDSRIRAFGKIDTSMKAAMYIMQIKDKDKPWANVIRSRRGASDEDATRGDALLEEFGNNYMPNAYSNFEKAKERVLEIQQMFNDEFPVPWEMRPSMPEWKAFEKILLGLMKAKVNYFRLHDELCHYYLMYKVGAVGAEDLAVIDSERIGIHLLSEMPSTMDSWHSGLVLVPLDDNGCSFAAKNMPETYEVYQKCKTDLDETQRLLRELAFDMRCMDMVRFDLVVIACREKVDYTIETINKLTAAIKEWHAEFKIMEKSAAEIAELDHEMAIEWKDFADALPAYVNERAKGPLMITNSKIDKYYPCNNSLTRICAMAAMEPCVPKSFSCGDRIKWWNKDRYTKWCDDYMGLGRDDVHDFRKELVDRLNAIDMGKAEYCVGSKE